MSQFTRSGLAALLVVGAACQPAPKAETATIGAESAATPAGLSAQDEAAVRAVDAEWARAATAGEASVCCANWRGSAVFAPCRKTASAGSPTAAPLPRSWRA